MTQEQPRDATNYYLCTKCSKACDTFRYRIVCGNGLRKGCNCEACRRRRAGLSAETGEPMSRCCQAPVRVVTAKEG